MIILLYETLLVEYCTYMKAYPKVPGLAARTENGK
jgi:hypothetical protein